MRTNCVVALLLVAMVAVNAVSIATRDSELLDIESEFEMAVDAEADAEAWPVWPDLPPYMGDVGKGYTCAAPNTIPARFLKDEANPGLVKQFTTTVQNLNIGGYPRVKNCDKARARLDMNVYAHGFVLGAMGAKTPDGCIAKVAASFGPIGLQLKDMMVAPNAANDPMIYIAKLNELGKTVVPTLNALVAGPLKPCPAAAAAIQKIVAAISRPELFTEKGSLSEPQVRALHYLNNANDACESSPNASGDKIVPPVCGYEFGFFSGAALASFARGPGAASAPSAPSAARAPPGPGA